MIRLLNSFAFAFKGLKHCIKLERNFAVQSCFAIGSVLLGLLFQISSTEWIILLSCIAFVLCLEMVNSAIEHLCNVVCREYNPAIGRIKDIAAGSVLLASILSFVIGCFIFLPKIFLLADA